MIALHDSGLKKEDIHFVEIIGGSTRIPAIQKRIAAFFEREEVLSKTLNMDEAIARGCSLQCAIVSPLFKVRDYQIKDVTAYGIKISWDPVQESGSTESVLFKPAVPIPSTKAITFYRSSPFEIRAEYSTKELLPPGTSPFIGRFAISDVKPNADGSLSDVKVKVRINESGIFSLASAELFEDIDDPMETEASAEKPAAAAEPAKDESGDVKMGEEAKKKKKLKKDLPVASTSSRLTPEVLNRMRETEGQMIASDKLIFETQEKKNSLESYIYEMRNKIEGSHSEFEEESVKEVFRGKLSEIESWLYDEGDAATKSTFVEKLTELQKIGSPIELRYREADERPSAISDLQKTISQFVSLASSGDSKYEHIEAADRQKVLDECKKKESWLNDALAEQNKLKKTQTPKTSAAQYKSARENLVMFCAPIMNKPKPKPKEEPPKETPPPQTEAKKEEPKKEDAKDMDVD